MFNHLVINGKPITQASDLFSITKDENLIDFVALLLHKEDLPIVFSTSGTTGKPTLMEFSKKQIQESAQRTCHFFQLNEKDTALLAMPAKYVAGRMVIARAALSGMQIQLGEISLNPLKKIPEKHSITFIAITPAQAATLLEFEFDKLNQIQTIIIGGGEISPSLEKELLKLNGNVYATYAMTETLSHIALRKIGEKHYFALPDVHFSVNENNCLQVHVPYLYDYALQTKDVVELIDEKTFIWLGRLDNVINTGGIKVYAENIERKLENHQELKGLRYYVSSQKDAVFGQIPVLFVENSQKTSISLEKINNLLDKYEKIKAVFYEDKFEETETGKMKRKTL